MATALDKTDANLFTVSSRDALDLLPLFKAFSDVKRPNEFEWGPS